MIKSNVQETTTTTGTGSITLSGASENGETFTSNYALNIRFPYYIDDRAGNYEEGVGYLSGTTTLVRESPLKGSAALPVNFGAGTKEVFVGANSTSFVKDALGLSDLGSSVKFMNSANAIRLNSTHTMVANRQYFFEAAYNRAVVVDLMATQITTGAGTASNNMHIGLYEIDPTTGKAGSLLIEATGLDPSVSGLVSGSCAETLIQPGVYMLSVWCDVAVVLRANDGTIVGVSSTAANNNLLSAGHWYESGLTSLTALPNPAVVSSNNASGKLIAVAIGHT